MNFWENFSIDLVYYYTAMTSKDYRTQSNPTKPRFLNILRIVTACSSSSVMPLASRTPWAMSSTQFNQTQANPTKPNNTQPNSIKLKQFNDSTKINPTKTKPSKLNQIKPKPKQTQPNRIEPNKIHSNPINQIHYDITQYYKSLNSPTQPDAALYHTTRKRLHTA